MARAKLIKHPEWGNGRIDFQPWPYPTATKLIVEAMNNTVVSGDTAFLKGLDPARVADELVDYSFVKNALEKFPQWKNDPSVSKGDPFTRRGDRAGMTLEIVAEAEAVDGMKQGSPAASRELNAAPRTRLRSAGSTAAGKSPPSFCSGG